MLHVDMFSSKNVSTNRLNQTEQRQSVPTVNRIKTTFFSRNEFPLTPSHEFPSTEISSNVHIHTKKRRHVRPCFHEARLLWPQMMAIHIWKCGCTRHVRSAIQVKSKYYSSNTLYYKILLCTTPYYKVLRQYYSVLESTKYYSSTILYYSVLQSTTPVLLRTRKYKKFVDVPKRSETGLKPSETVGKQLYPLILHLYGNLWTSQRGLKQAWNRLKL